MPKIKEIRKEAINSFLSSPFLKKNRTYSLQDAALDADLILSYVLKTTRTHLIASLDDEITKTDEAKILFQHRYNGLSIAYILEEKEFYGLSFYVNHDVLIPKSDTEVLVEKAILAINEVSSISGASNNSLNILDVFTGSGCVAISIANALSSSKHHYTLIDISEKALNVAKRNAENHFSSLEYFSFCKHDALQLFPLNNNQKYDIILANPPYIPHNETLKLLSDGRNEPSLALDGGKDGLYFYYALAKNSFASLNEKGRLLSEIGDGQAENVSSIFKNAGFNFCTSYYDLSGEKRVVEARK
ncbi:MAG: peptide chain release factor N(5)-glutamine methyltransferase [Treponema sp.]